MNDDKDYENYLSNKKHPVCKIFDCYYEHEYFNVVQPLQRKSCHLCAYNYEKLRKLADTIKQETLLAKHYPRRIQFTAKFIEYTILLLGCLIAIYSLAYFYFKIKH